jgi:predicted DNA binding CopG/RHH family protein
MPASATQRQERYATAISIPRHLAEHVAKRAAAMGLSSAAYIRLLIARDMGITLDGQPGAKA